MPAKPMPDSVVTAGIPEGTAATLNLPEDAWDMLGLGSSEGVSEKSLQVKNGQVVLLTAGDWFSSHRSSDHENQEAYRNQWQYEAESRLARIESKRSPLEKADEGLSTQKFAWSKEGQKAFEWRKIYHAMVGPGVFPNPDGGLITEQVFNPTVMRMYTDHRVMGQIVLPGVSHVSLFAATGSIGFPNPGGIASDWHMSIKEVLFERPYIVNSGAELIAAIQSGADPAELANQGGGMQAAILPVGVPMTYCRATSVSKEKGSIKPTIDWAK